MKFTWFNLMPWPYLPDDFRHQHRSVWGGYSQHALRPAQVHVYHEYLDQLGTRRQLGFDGIGCKRAPPERLWAHAVAQP
jgi:hypothetical protein